MECIVHPVLCKSGTIFCCCRIWRGSSDHGYFATQGDAYKARLLRWYQPDRRLDNVRVKEVRSSLARLLYVWFIKECDY